MSAEGSGTRRGFLGGLFIFAAGAVATALTGCAAEAGSGDGEAAGGVARQGFAEEAVPLQPWMRYRTALPANVPGVRRLPEAAVPATGPITTKLT